MTKSIKDNPKKRGRPATGNAPLVGVRMTEEFQAEIRAWSKKQPDDPALATAIRRLVELGLKARPPKKVNLTMKDSDGRILLPAGGLKAKGR
ncbi:hypothetical protein ACO2JO_14505 [Leptospira interrogans]